jgi:hypothetical protein
MNAQIYLNVNARLAYYDAMKATAPARVEKIRREKRPRKPLLRMPKQGRVVLLTTENQRA